MNQQRQTILSNILYPLNLKIPNATNIFIKLTLQEVFETAAQINKELLEQFLINRLNCSLINTFNLIFTLNVEKWYRK